MKITEVVLVNKKGRYLHCWLSSQGRKLRVGLTLNLDDGDKNVLWEIIEVYGTQDHHEIRRSWNVGGL
jgi:hypothetical protein